MDTCDPRLLSLQAVLPSSKFPKPEWMGLVWGADSFSGSPPSLRGSFKTPLSFLKVGTQQIGVFVQNIDFPLHASRTESEFEGMELTI